jgi:hypothetical protein
VVVLTASPGVSAFFEQLAVFELGEELSRSPTLEKLHALRQLLLNVPSKETTAQIKALQGDFIEMAPHPNRKQRGFETARYRV